MNQFVINGTVNFDNVDKLTQQERDLLFSAIEANFKGFKNKYIFIL